MNYKRFRRLYRLGTCIIVAGAGVRAKYVRGLPLRRATRPIEIWTLDFLPIGSSRPGFSRA